MLFSTPVFIFLFLPFFLLIYHALPQARDRLARRKINWRNVFLFGASLLFYSWGEGLVVFILLVSITINYVAGLLVYYKQGKIGVFFSIAGSLYLLFYYKYAGFAAQTLRQITEKVGWSIEWLDSLGSILMPIGISFYTFQGISYALDAYWGRIKINRNFIDYGTYIAMFPHQIAGPIVRYADIDTEINSRQTNLYGFSLGIERFIIGLAKKVLLANYFARIADTIFGIPIDSVSPVIAWVGIIAYTLQIYFDFSGYSDMAIGLGKMLGFDFKENFNYPYTARSIQDFWRRWHISLSGWFRDYLYVPLGGSRGSTKKTYRNLLIVFFVTGLWHGASWNFIFWGLFHGLFLLVERTGLGKQLKQAPAWVSHIYTLLIVTVGWVFFRADNLSDAIQYLSRMFWVDQATHDWLGYSNIYFLTVPKVCVLLIGSLLSTPVYHWWTQKWQQRVPGFLRPILYTIGLFGLFTVTIIFLAASTYNPFIYFRF